MIKRPSILLVSLTLQLLLFLHPVRSEIIVDQVDSKFLGNVQKELTLIRAGKRGVACQELIRRLDNTSVQTTIKPITTDEKTWHPNDRKGTRSHVVPLDTKLRGGARTTPTAVILYLHPPRVDSSMSLFKLGTFIHELAIAADFNRGEFSGDYRVVEKRATFFRNAWKDSRGGELILVSDRVPTPEYQDAKQAEMLTSEYVEFFPILDLKSVKEKYFEPLPEESESDSAEDTDNP